MSDLSKLIVAVEAGIIANPTHANEFDAVGRENGTARDAYCGSLDVAKKLHEALLPGWVWDVGVYADSEPYHFACVTKLTEGVAKDAHDGTDLDPARAWLLAILKAYEATR